MKPTSPPPITIQTCDIVEVRQGQRESRRDSVVVEEPLALQLRYGPIRDRQRSPFTTTMRTPDADHDLARGMLLTEGVLTDPKLILSITEIEPNHLRIDLHPDVAITPESFARHSIASAACGLCGKLALDTLEPHCPALAPGPKAPVHILQSLPQKLSLEQSLFRETGGLHAAGLADISGEILAVREDIGRHNAVDKVLGAIWGRRPFPPILVVSGRAGFELVQKAAIVGIPIFVAVGAPSSLAVDLAARIGMTLIGFTRQDRFNIYTHPERVGQ